MVGRQIKQLSMEQFCLEHCTDNGLMIAFAGFQKIKEQTKDFSIDVAPRWSLENVQ